MRGKHNLTQKMFKDNFTPETDVKQKKPEVKPEVKQELPSVADLRSVLEGSSAASGAGCASAQVGAAACFFASDARSCSVPSQLHTLVGHLPAASIAHWASHQKSITLGDMLSEARLTGE